MSILKRLPSSIRERDWVAAAIDIGVVAIGILMALAVDDWNKDREASAQRLELLRLAHDEVRNNELTINSYIEGLLGELAELEAVLVLVGEPSVSAAIPEKQCEAIAVSHSTPNNTWILPTVERLVSTQQLNAPEDAAVRAAAQDFLDSLGFQRSEELRANADTIHLPAAYPDLISIRLSTERELRGEYVDAKKLSMHCDLQAIREHPAFLSSLSLNYGVQAFLTNGARGNVQLRVSALREALDERLGIAPP